jgi:transglutaminase-like putative cysteine protease
MIYDVSHRTTLLYSSAVQMAQFTLRLRPVDWPGQTVEDFTLSVEPAPATVSSTIGPFGQTETRLTLAQPSDRITIVSRFRVSLDQQGSLDVRAAPSADAVRAMALASLDLGPRGPATYIYGSANAPLSDEIGQWAARYVNGSDTIVAAGQALMQALHRYFQFDAQATRPDMPPLEAFKQRRGVCQDFSHVMIVAARAHGLPAAYVSGYLRTLPPAGKPRLVGADAMHAWVALWCGADLGWLGFDPTNDCMAGIDHIVVSIGRDYADVAPLDGVFHGGQGQTMEVAVDVEPRP